MAALARKEKSFDSAFSGSFVLGQSQEKLLSFHCIERTCRKSYLSFNNVILTCKLGVFQKHRVKFIGLMGNLVFSLPRFAKALLERLEYFQLKWRPH